MPDNAFCLLSVNIVNSPRNHYETVRNIKVVSTDSFKQLEVASKVGYVTNMSSGCRQEEASLDDLDSISIFWNKDNDLEEKISHSFHKEGIFIFEFEKARKKYNQ